MDQYDSDGVVVERGQIQPMPADQSRPQNLIFASGTCGEVFGALCEMQGAMDAPKRTKTAKVKGRSRSGSEYEYEYAYAPLEEIIATIKEPMSQHGLAYRQFLASREGVWVMRTIIGHKSGEWMAADYPIFYDDARGMQGFASGVTYARRYGLMLALGIAAEDDDDANVADGQPATFRQKPPQAAARARTVPEAAPGPSEANTDGSGRPTPRALFNTMFRAVENVGTLRELDAMRASQDWKDMEAAVRADTGGEAAMKRLNNLVEGRRDYFLAGA